MTKEKELYRIEKQVRMIIESFDKNEITIAEALSITLSVFHTALLANSTGSAASQMVADEFEHFVTYLRTGVMPEGTAMSITKDGKPVTVN